jgi:hypothetical protein
VPRSASSHPFDALIQYAADLLTERLSGLMAQKPGPRGKSANERRRQTMTGRKLDMSCRVAGCKNRSGGPRHGFMCEQHQKLPKKQQIAAREAWNAKHAA